MKPQQKTLVTIAAIVVILVIVYIATRTSQAPLTQTSTNGTGDALDAPLAPGAEVAGDEERSNLTRWLRFQRNAAGISFLYPSRYFVSGLFENSDTISVNLNKVSDKPKIKRAEIDHNPHFEFTAFKNTTGLTLDSIAELWGRDILGSTFVRSTSCQATTVAGEPAMKCSVYAGADKGGFMDVIFTKHNDREFKFEAQSAKNDDVVHSDLPRILANLHWL